MEKVGDALRAEGMERETEKIGLGACSGKSFVGSLAWFPLDVLELAQPDPLSFVVPVCSHRGTEEGPPGGDE